MVFVFDLDDTICETDEYSEEFILKFFKENNLPYIQIAKNVRYAEMKFDWEEETARKWYKEFGDEMLLNFPIKNNAVQIINKLYEKGHRIVIATARTDDWHTNPIENTKKWLEKVGLKYHKLIVGRNDKEEVCDTENADVFVDDDIDITTRVFNKFENQNKKCKVFLTNTNYNQNLPTPSGITRIIDFKALLDI